MRISLPTGLGSAFAALLFSGLSASAGTFSYTEFNSDANVGIYADDVFTAKTDFARPAADRVVNGVAFTDWDLTGSTPTGGLPSYVLNLNPPSSLGRLPSFGGSAALIVSDFFYGGDVNHPSLTLNNLQVGKTYVSSWYNQAYGDPGGRLVNITASDTNATIQFDENFSGNLRGNILRYTFTATSPSITFAFDAVSDNDSFHHYAFTNALARTDIVTPRVFQAVGTGQLNPLQAFSGEVRSGDLLETSVLAGGITASGNFTQESAGGLAKLTDGNFVIKGGNVTQGQPDANSEIATVANGAFIQYALDTTANAFGYDVSLIQLFGGWNDNGRDKQLFNVFYSKVGSDSYTLLGSENFDSQAAGGLPSAIWTAFDTNLTNVDGIRIEFPDGQENGYVGLGEIDVVGAPSAVPEPSTMALAMLSATALITRRRRR